MATFDARLYPKAFEAMEQGRKTVYALVCTPEYDFMCAGDRLEFGDFGSITVGTVRRYASLERLIEVEGWQNLVPDADGAEHAAQLVRAIPEWSDVKEEQLGVLALRVREAKRK